MTQSILYIIAGCNGAGKTTASYSVLPDLLECREFVNADEIAINIFAPIVDSWMFFNNENYTMLLANNQKVIHQALFNNIKDLCQNRKN